MLLIFNYKNHLKYLKTIISMDLLFHLWLILISQRVLLFKRTGNSHSSLQLFSSQMATEILSTCYVYVDIIIIIIIVWKSSQYRINDTTCLYHSQIYLFLGVEFLLLHYVQCSGTVLHPLHWGCESWGCRCYRQPRGQHHHGLRHRF